MRSAAYSKFDGNSNDYNGWSSIGAARAAVSGSELEASVWFQGTELGRSSDISILFYLRDAAGEEDYSDFTVGMDTGVLAVRQRDPVGTGDGATLPLELAAFGRQINLTSLRVSKAGSAGGGTVTLTGAGDPREAGFGGADAIFAGLGVSMAQDSRLLLSLRGQGFSGGPFGMYVPGPGALQANVHAVHGNNPRSVERGQPDDKLPRHALSKDRDGLSDVDIRVKDGVQGDATDL